MSATGSGAQVTTRSERFIALSSLLTGFEPLRLLGTGVSDAYLQALDAILPAGTVDDLLGAHDALPAGEAQPAAVSATILGDQKLGPVARNLILMWYCGTWTALPEAWRSAYGASPQDVDHVVSAETYQAGLQWVVAGAHPAGAQEQGYGAWASPPAGSGG